MYTSRQLLELIKQAYAEDQPHAGSPGRQPGSTGRTAPLSRWERDSRRTAIVGGLATVGAASTAYDAFKKRGLPKIKNKAGSIGKFTTNAFKTK